MSDTSGFNPRARDGREVVNTPIHNFSCFNPRARDGREPIPTPCVLGLARFNPRARDGRENLNSYHRVINMVSIHAPVMDANLCSSNNRR